jgi:AraC-like DNA-binding protein
MEMSLHVITNLILAVVCLSMGTVFLVFPTPQKTGLFKYRISLKVIASSYFILMVLTMVILIFRLPDNAREHLTFTGISISSFQAFLFTFALITLLDPKYVTLKNIGLHIWPFIVLVLMFAISYKLFGNPVITQFNELGLYISNPTLWIRITIYGYYIFQLLFYTWLFLKEEQVYKNNMMNYFSDEVWLKLSWVRVAFFSSLTVGVIAMLSYFFPQKYDWIFTLIYSVFYFGFAIEYVKYDKIYRIIEPAVEEEKTEIPVSASKTRIKQDWQPLKEQILNNQYYLESGINIEDLARRLGVGRTVLSTLINRDEGMNFNTWINTQRVNKAKELLINDPDETLTNISERVGYSEHANFSRQFKQITGESPLLWRKKQLVKVGA